MSTTALTPAEARAMWLRAAVFWHKQAEARKREGKWREVRQARQEASAAETRAHELEQRPEAQAS